MGSELTDEALREIEAQVETYDTPTHRTNVTARRYVEHVAKLLAEVRRLRGNRFGFNEHPTDAGMVATMRDLAQYFDEQDPNGSPFAALIRDHADRIERGLAEIARLSAAYDGVAKERDAWRGKAEENAVIVDAAKAYVDLVDEYEEAAQSRSWGACDDISERRSAAFDDLLANVRAIDAKETGT